MDKLQKEIVDNLGTKMYIIDKEMESKKNYKNLIDTFFDYLRSGFEIKEFREAPVYYKFHEDGDVYSMQMRHFLTNLIFWYPILELGAVDEIDERFIVDTSRISSGYIENYLNENIIIPFGERISNKKLNKVLHDVIYNLSRISTDFNIILGLTVNIETFIDVANRNERFDEIIHTKIDDTMQPADIEKYLHDLMCEEIQILMNEENALKPMLRCGAGIKNKQLAEMTINGGLKPDLGGNTIPIPINSNLLVGGLSNITNYYIDSIGGRKSLIANKTVMGKSGYFVKKVMLAVTDIHLRKDEEMCRSINPITYTIKTQTHLNRLVGRVYRLPHGREYRVLTENDTHLIGKTIMVKSPTTCASKHGICKYCYGPSLYHTNKELASIGAYAGAVITNPLSQNILSTKHLNTTDSEIIEFDNAFSKYFNLTANEITLNSNISNQEDYSILIISDNIVTLSELDEGEINTFVPLFHVRNNTTGDIVEISEKSMKDLYISPEFLKVMKRCKKKGVYEVNFLDIPDDCRLFLLEIANNELTKPLYNIMGLLDSKKARDTGYNISDICQRMLDLMIESGINFQAVHGEILITPLIRSMEDVLVRPNFAKYLSDDDVQILTVTAALEKHPSPLVGLSSSYLKKQLREPLTFKKHGKSAIDPMFRPSL